MSIARKSMIVAVTLAAGALGAVSAASADTSTNANTSTSPAAAASGTGSVTLTTPKRTVTVSAAELKCRVANGHYQLYARGRRDRRGLTLAMNVPHYTGAGNYTATVRVLMHRPYRLGLRTFHAPVTLTATGGSASGTRTLQGRVNPANTGKTVELSASWTCAA